MRQPGTQFEQGQLFDPGPRRDPWAMHPDNWLNDDSRGPVVYHGSRSPSLPASDDSARSIDYGGSAAGMHFGTAAAARDRTGPKSGRDYIHTARIPSGSISKHLYTDTEANYDTGVEARVLEGEAVRYVNDTEDQGSISYRTMPQNVSTWGEEVMASTNAHPALKHLASRGYNPAIDVRGEHEANYAPPTQGRLFGHLPLVQDVQFQPTLTKTGLRK